MESVGDGREERRLEAKIEVRFLSFSTGWSVLWRRVERRKSDVDGAYAEGSVGDSISSNCSVGVENLTAVDGSEAKVGGEGRYLSMVEASMSDNEGKLR